MRKMLSVVLLILCLGTTAALYRLDVLNLAVLQQHHQVFVHYFHSHPVASYGLFMASLTLLVSFSLPGTMLYMLFAGSAFELPVAVTVVVICRAMGSVVAFLIARYLARQWVRERFGNSVEKLDRGVEREGWLYLAMLRLAPILPDSVINPGMGLTAIRLPVFFWVSVIGMIPYVVLYAMAGDRLTSMNDAADVLDPRWLMILTAGAVLLFLGSRLLRSRREAV